jgi:hypothetical protein
MDVVSRRLELLKLEGLGLSQAEIVKQLSQNAVCSQRTIYQDWETRASWQPSLQGFIKSENGLLKTINRNDQIYRLAGTLFLSSPNPLVQIGALKIMLQVNSSMNDMFVLSDVLSRLKVLEKKATIGVFVP